MSMRQREPRRKRRPLRPEKSKLGVTNVQSTSGGPSGEAAGSFGASSRRGTTFAPTRRALGEHEAPKRRRSWSSMRARDPSTAELQNPNSTGCLPPGPGAATPAAAAPGSGVVVQASIEIRAAVHEVLRRWSEFSLLRESAALIRQAVASRVDFEPLEAARSRITLQLEHPVALPEPARARRALEDHLSAFGGFVDENGPGPCRS